MKILALPMLMVLAFLAAVQGCRKSISASTSGTSTTPRHVTKGILVSGGYGENYDVLKSVELFIPETGKTCSYPDMPVGIRAHTLNMVGDDLVVCGGKDNQFSPSKSCIHLSPTATSNWTSYATTRNARYYHTGWVSQSGELLLLGGFGRPGYAEIVNAGTSTGREIELDQEDVGSHCGIDAKDSVILTGREYSERKVARYNLQGFVENLPEMNQGRHGHGCGSYLSGVTMVLIVTGGKFYEEILSSTERMPIGAAAWTTVNALPRALVNMASVTIGNLVYLTGGMDEEDVIRSEILVLDGKHWREVGLLQKARLDHTATMINKASFIEFCK